MFLTKPLLKTALLIFLPLGIAASSLNVAHAQSGPAVTALQPAPDIVGRLLGGGRFRLLQQRGTPVVVNFFWVNCVPCRVEMPELAQLEKIYPKVKFISVHVEDEPDEAVAEFVRKLPGAPSTIVLANRRVQTNYATLGLPETHLLNKDGQIVQTLSGYTEKTLLDLKKWLSAQK